MYWVYAMIMFCISIGLGIYITIYFKNLFEWANEFRTAAHLTSSDYGENINRSYAIIGAAIVIGMAGVGGTFSLTSVVLFIHFN
jgi:hypothetical protein